MPSTCACGCGEIPGQGRFRPGHDQKLRADAERRAGGLLSLVQLVDAAEQFRAGTLSLTAFGERVRASGPQT